MVIAVVEWCWPNSAFRFSRETLERRVHRRRRLARPTAHRRPPTSPTTIQSVVILLLPLPGTSSPNIVPSLLVSSVLGGAVVLAMLGPSLMATITGPVVGGMSDGGTVGAKVSPRTVGNRDDGAIDGSADVCGPRVYRVGVTVAVGAGDTRLLAAVFGGVVGANGSARAVGAEDIGADGDAVGAPNVGAGVTGAVVGADVAPSSVGAVELGAEVGAAVRHHGTSGQPPSEFDG